MTAPTRDLSAEISERTERLRELGASVRELRQTPADKRSDGYAQDLLVRSRELAALDAEHQALLSERQGEILSSMAERLEQMGAERGRGPRGGTLDVGEQGYRSLGEQVASGDDYDAWVKRGVRSGTYEHHVRNLLTTGTGTAGTSTNAGLFVPVGSPTMPPQMISRRRLFVRDLVAPGTTNLGSIPFIREYNAALLEYGASAVAEGSAKPEVNMQFERDDAPVRKLAAWIQATEEILSDAPTLRSYIDARMEYMLRLREEFELLNGDGTVPHLKGILQQTGLQTATSLTGDNLQGIANGAEKIELAEGEADGVALHPTAFWDIATRRNEASNTGSFDVNPFQSPDGMRPWGLNAVRTRSLAATNAIVGAWRMGAQIFDREGVTIRVGDQHSDYFVKNLLVILAEERLAFAVYRPDFFCSVTFS